MNYTLKVKMLKGERWYGGVVDNGFRMPVSSKSVYKTDMCSNPTSCALSTYFVSSKGRYLFSEKGFSAKFFFGTITCSSDKAPIVLGDGFETLKGAYLALCKKYFPPTGKMPNDLSFTLPRYSTKMMLGRRQTQEEILDYASGILNTGLVKGELIIDDGWQKNYGDWDFNDRFTSPADMVKELKSKGFKVMLSISPFVSSACPEFEKMKTDGMLVKDANGVAFRKWQYGEDAVLDMSNPLTQQWLTEKTDYLIDTYGIDGFKFDVGDVRVYKDGDINYGNVDGDTQTNLFCTFAEKFVCNEVRTGTNLYSKGLVLRLSDRTHSWDKKTGLASVVPALLTAGICGYPYVCPGTVGGLYPTPGVESFCDKELIVRYAQTAALTPTMQFSYDAWHDKVSQLVGNVRDSVFMHVEYSDEILRLAREASTTGEPILKYMEYVFPGEGLEDVNDQFMLGDFLVAPVTSEEQTTKRIRLPMGSWISMSDNEVHEGGKTITVPVDLWELPVFKKV